MSSASLRIIADVLGSRDDAQMVLDALAAEGLVVVPRIPTQAMLDAAYWPSYGDQPADVWEEMVRASATE